MEAENLGAVAGISRGGDVQQDLPHAARPAHAGGQDREGVIAHLDSGEQVQQRANSERDHAGALHQAQRARRLALAELQVQ